MTSDTASNAGKWRPAAAIQASFLHRFGVNEVGGYNFMFLGSFLLCGLTTTWVLRQRLPLWIYPLAYIVFCALMLGAILCKDRALRGWRLDRPRNSTPTAVPV